MKETRYKDMDKVTSLVFRMLMHQKENSTMNRFIEEIIGLLDLDVLEEIKSSILELKDTEYTYVEEVPYNPSYINHQRNWIKELLSSGKVGDPDSLKWNIVFEIIDDAFPDYKALSYDHDDLDQKMRTTPILPSSLHEWFLAKMLNPQNEQDIFGCVYVYCRCVHYDANPYAKRYEMPETYFEKVIHLSDPTYRRKVPELFDSYLLCRGAKEIDWLKILQLMLQLCDDGDTEVSTSMVQIIKESKRFKPKIYRKERPYNPLFLEYLENGKNPDLRSWIVSHPYVPKETLLKLTKDPNEIVSSAAEKAILKKL